MTLTYTDHSQYHLWLVLGQHLFDSSIVGVDAALVYSEFFYCSRYGHNLRSDENDAIVNTTNS